MNKEITNQDNKDSSQITEQYISLKRILASKNKNALKYIPKPLLKWFEKIIHLERINRTIYQYRDYKGVSFATCVLEDIKVDVEVVNPENIPKTGRPLVISNHPLGGIDGMALISEVGKFRSDIVFPVNDILCKLPGLKDVFIPVNKYGRNNENHKILEDAFASDSCMMFFPAGMVSRKHNNIIRDLDWKKSFIKKSIEYNRDIIPVYTDARNSNFFYRFSNIRKKIGMKFNIELIFLPDEMFKQKGKKIRLIFGKPIPFETFDKRFSQKQWADILKEFVYSLAKDPKAEFKVENYIKNQ
ncbi:MAG: 1-acyl-sn-glycerol-3-phosphate acyltransferase [Bacteroidales bacterium]|nr:1-acyl-sn-glycerol-3-phosphate acyltransferase [Bacteroidales bacterium]MDD4684531.1 1-acyl-sn-glycerol-3-phosphate acyltransferase [Bacteroidales bacterium]